MSAAALMAAAAMTMPMPAAAGTTVDIPSRTFAPAHLQVLVGDTVTWHNSDMTAHAVTADDHSFASERLAPGDAFEFTFDKPGDYSYYCPIHASMRGMVHVDALALMGPTRLLHPGATAHLSVLAPDGSGDVTLERLTATGAETVATATPDAGGHTSFAVPVRGPARYRARAGDLTSAVTTVRVAPRITATVRRRGPVVTVRATIAPALPGATVALQRYVPLRFAFLAVKTTRTAGGGHVTFTVRAPRRTAFRVALVKARGGWANAGSPRAAG